MGYHTLMIHRTDYLEHMVNMMNSHDTLDRVSGISLVARIISIYLLLF